jgi:hypothetical protein
MNTLCKLWITSTLQRILLWSLLLTAALTLTSTQHPLYPLALKRSAMLSLLTLRTTSLLQAICLSLQTVQSITAPQNRSLLLPQQLKPSTSVSSMLLRKQLGLHVSADRLLGQRRPPN